MKRFKLLALLVMTIASAYAANGTIFSDDVRLVQDGKVTTVKMTFKVTDETKKECEVYGNFNVIDGEYVYTRCVDVETSGDITVPATAKGYSVVGVDGWAFYDCKKLTGFTFEEGIRYINSAACYGTAATFCVLPSTLEKMGHPFFRCSKLVSVTINREEPPTIDDSGFGYINEDAKLCVPDREKYDVEPWTQWFKSENIVSTVGDKYNVWVNGTQMDSFLMESFAQQGIEFDGDHTLTLTNANLNVISDYGIRTTIHDMVIRLVGKNTITGEGTAIMQSCEDTYSAQGYGSLRFEGEGSLTIRMNEGTSNGIATFGSHVTLSNCGDIRIHAVNGIAGSATFISALFGGKGDVETEKLTVENTNLSITCSSGGSTVMMHSVNMIDTELRLPEEAWFEFPFYWQLDNTGSQVGPENLVISKAGKGVIINEMTFPDDHLRDYFLKSDIGEDQFLTDNELAANTMFDLHYKNIADIKGMENFPNITFLNVAWNDLTELDLTAMTTLEQVVCYSNQLTSIKAPQGERFWRISCYLNYLYGDRVDELINSLPKHMGGTIEFIEGSATTEENAIDARQVAAAMNKGWTIEWRETTDSDWEAYEGIPIDGFEVYENLAIAGTYPNSDNRENLNPLFDAAGYPVTKGTISYEPESNTLVFNNATVEGTAIGEDMDEHILSLADLTIRVEGENHISTCSMISLDGGITFTGDGTMELSNFLLLYFADELSKKNVPARREEAADGVRRLTVNGPAVDFLFDGDVTMIGGEASILVDVPTGKLRLYGENRTMPLLVAYGPLEFAPGTTISDPKGLTVGEAEFMEMDFYTLVDSEGNFVTDGWVTIEHAIPTGLEGIEHLPLNIDQPTYDLQGRRVNRLARGIYIRGGKKVVVK